MRTAMFGGFVLAALIFANGVSLDIVAADKDAKAEKKDKKADKKDTKAAASGQGDGEAAPIYGVKIPPGYRDWKLIAGNQFLVAGKADQLRAQLGNDIAIKAFKEKMIPFPDGSIIGAIHWTRVPSKDNNKVLAGPFPGAQSFVVGSPVNVQFMVKDSKKYAATGGWGFADFTDGKPASEAVHNTCFSCHESAKDRDYVFTRYAP